MVINDLWDTISAVPDPEIPVLTIGDLGILRDVCVDPDGRIVVTITPTYSGCPALAEIKADIAKSLADVGIDDCDIRTQLTPVWTTDWMTQDTLDRLNAYGIAPPEAREAVLQIGVRCPQCGSVNTRKRSHYGAALCLAQHVCSSCAEPFDQFKRY
jgi:ring-1,2-phenylacetyl-CoA epoxidase subunit PaaD